MNFFLNCGVLIECDGEDRLPPPPPARSDELDIEYDSIWCGGGSGEWCNDEIPSFSVDDDGIECGMLCELELSWSIR